MGIGKGIRSYILEDEFKITYVDNKVNVLNYDSIGHFDDNKVIINYENKTVIIKGKSLVVSKLMNDEILIEGNIINIEFR